MFVFPEKTKLKWQQAEILGSNMKLELETKVRERRVFLVLIARNAEIV
jgi:hypothetical protein